MSVRRAPIFDVLPTFDRPWLRLIDAPTPVHHLKTLGSQINHSNLWVKLDGLSGDLYGGSKIRNLEFLLGETLKRRSSKVVTFGAVESNFAVATALYAQSLNIKADLFLANFSHSDDEVVASDLNVLSRMGATVHYVSKFECFVRHLDAKHLGFSSARDKSATIIPIGGACRVGCLGLLNATIELHQQIRSGAIPAPSAIFLPLGSGGTIAGLHAGLSLLGMSCSIIGIRIAGGPSPQSLLRLSSQTLSYAHANYGSLIPTTSSTPKIEIWNSDPFAGYAIPADETGRVTRRLLETEGIHLDQKYTAKAMSVFLDYVVRSQDRRPLLFWNTCNNRPEPWR